MANTKDIKKQYEDIKAKEASAQVKQAELNLEIAKLRQQRIDMLNRADPEILASLSHW